MIPRPELLNMLEKEFATTAKVINAFPEGKLDFKPHERSQDVRKIISTFVFELYLVKIYVFGEKMDLSIFKTYHPDSVKQLVSDFKKETDEVLKKLESFPEENMNNIVEFAHTKFNINDFILMMLHDQIHHRGQMTVYIRMAGGKVPSVYGPSADDSSTNF